MTNIQDSIAELERAIKHHPDAHIKNYERLKSIYKQHTIAMCKVLTALLSIFEDRKFFFVIEAEVPEHGHRARPEDLVGWIEGIGILVLEVKSHSIGGIRSFQNNVPQVIYQGCQAPDCDLLDQPKDFAYRLKALIERKFDDEEIELPPIYFAGWLPNVSLFDLKAIGNPNIAHDKVWLSDMLDGETFLSRLPSMKNITRGVNTDRTSLEIFSKVFGVTSGLRSTRAIRPTMPATMGHLIDQRALQIKQLTSEQEKLAFSPLLVKGPKVIRGVAGSGKSIVLCNAVAEILLREYSERELSPAKKNGRIEILILCYNRVLSGYLTDLIRQCFNARKPYKDWIFPKNRVTIVNIDRYAYSLTRYARMKYLQNDIHSTVQGLIDKGVRDKGRFKHIFIDEGQDIDLDWYPLIRELAIPNDEDGPSIIVFYDDAQNLYGIKRPGIGGTPPWTELLGKRPSSRGLNTIMRVGHRNTNEILSVSFNILLGAFSDYDPQMLEFADISAYSKDTIPDDPGLDHPNAGKPCVEKLGDRHYKVNFAVHSGNAPSIYCANSEAEFLSKFIRELKHQLDPSGHFVDPSDILIMAPTKDAVKAVAERLQQENIDAHIAIKLSKEDDRRDQAFFQKGKVTLTTINSAKGYTAHVCHIIYVHELQQYDAPLQQLQRARAQFHVGCTRATLQLGIWGRDCPLLQEAQTAVSEL